MQHATRTIGPRPDVRADSVLAVEYAQPLVFPQLTPESPAVPLVVCSRVVLCIARGGGCVGGVSQDGFCVVVSFFVGCY